MGVTLGWGLRQVVLVLTMALRMTRVLRMAATMATLPGLPAAVSRSKVSRITGL